MLKLKEKILKTIFKNVKISDVVLIAAKESIIKNNDNLLNKKRSFKNESINRIS